MSALPPNWTRYQTDEGKEYFHNNVTNQTQWERPSEPISTSEVYQYKPNDADMELRSPTPDTSAGVSLGDSGRQTSFGMTSPSRSGNAQAEETVSLRQGMGGGGIAAGIGAGLTSVISAATAEDGGSASGFFDSLLSNAQLMFDVSTDDVVKRLKAAVLPVERAAGMVDHGAVASDLRNRPDFWGPFWVATTAILFLAATGNFATLLANKNSQDAVFKANYSLVSTAATAIYGCLVGVPIATRIALWISGQEATTVNFKQMICVYGYSLTPIIPITILCLVDSWLLRNLAVGVGLATALLFIRTNLWTDISVEAPTLKWTLIVLLAGSQVLIFGLYRVHFFRGIVK
eukprot:TRINITY_DN20257_c0_g1_i1.p1 TRINITY_DN20257_c0_g1~~TRINITY_DN20257_c0_g1_i1.p1  ORF type:complete len:346 (-),score=52.08 TRINITY_DN20257_c0_g1_i1:69-1106(-)